MSPASIRSNRPNAAVKVPEPGGDLVERRVEGERRGGSSEGVVDVVETGQRQRHPHRAGGRDEIEHRRVERLQVDRACGDVERRPAVPAVRAAVVAEVADVGRGVVIGLAAADAVLRVGRMLQRRPCEPWIVDAEAQRTGPPVREIGDERIVGVHDEGRGGRERRHGGPPPFRDVLELAVAVELVAKEVAERDDPRTHPLDHLRQGELVDLEQAEIGVGRREEGGGDARGEIGSGVVPGKPVPAAEDASEHGARRRLAVRRGDNGDPGGQLRRERVQSAGIDLPEELPGQRRAPAAPDGTREAPDEAGGRRLCVEAYSHGNEPTPHRIELNRTSVLAHLQLSQNDLQ